VEILEKYNKKRDFTKTPEPVGRRDTRQYNNTITTTTNKVGKELRFVVQKHDATKLHYDFPI